MLRAGKGVLLTLTSLEVTVDRGFDRIAKTGRTTLPDRKKGRNGS